MGAAFGLLGLLITVVIILYLMAGGPGSGPGYLQTVATANKQAKAQVNVMGGRDPTGQMLATDSIHMHIDRGPTDGGKPKLMVSEVMAGGPMEEKFGIQAGDQILELGSLDVDQNVTTLDDGVAFLHDAYARDWPVVVIRKGQKIQLPTQEHLAAIAQRDKQAAAAAAASTATPTPVTPTPAPASPGGLDSLLDKVRAGQ